MRSKDRPADGNRSSSNPVVKSGKMSGPTKITKTTVERLERAGSSESAKIARDYVAD